MKRNKFVFLFLLLSTSLFAEEAINIDPFITENLEEIQSISDKSLVEKEDFVLTYLDSIEALNIIPKHEFDLYRKLYEGRLLLSKKKDQEYINLFEPIKESFAGHKFLYIEIINSLGNAYYNLELYLVAKDYFIQHQELHKLTYVKHKSNYKQVGDFYFLAEDYETALLEYKNSYKKYYPDKRSNFFLGHLANNVGVSCTRLAQVDSALLYLNRAKYHWNIEARGKKEFLLALVDGNIAQVLMLEQKFEQAIPLLKKDIENSTEESIDNVYISKIELANCYLGLNQVIEAKALCDELSENVSDNDITIDVKIKHALLGIEVYQRVGEMEKQLYYFNEHKRQTELKNRKRKEISDKQLAVLFDLDDKKKKIEQQALELAKTELIEAERSRLLWISISVGILALLFALLYFIQRKIKSHAIKQKEQAEVFANDKDTLMREMHHRVKNNLQVVSSILQIQSANSNNKETKDGLTIGRNRVQTIAAIHDLLYTHEDVENVRIEELLQRLIGQNEQLNHQRADVSLEIDEISLPLEKVIPLSLIVNEFLTNSYKHAFKDMEVGKIEIELAKNSATNNENEAFILNYKDNGVGITHVAEPTKKAIGLKLINLMVQQLRGELTSHDGQGVNFTVAF